MQTTINYFFYLGNKLLGKKNTFCFNAYSQTHCSLGAGLFKGWSVDQYHSQTAVSLHHEGHYQTRLMVFPGKTQMSEAVALSAFIPLQTNNGQSAVDYSEHYQLGCHRTLQFPKPEFGPRFCHLFLTVITILEQKC